MNLSKGRKHFIGLLIATVLLFIAKPMYDSGHGNSTAATDLYNFSGKTYVCGIDLGDDMKGGHGLETGLAYEIIKTFAQDHNCNISIKISRRRENLIDSLKQGKIDMLIVHHNDLETDEDIILSENLTQCCAFALYHDKDNHIDEVNRWLEVYTQSEEFIKMQDLFTRPNNPVRLAERGVKRDTLCPYDELLKRYAKDLGWDWRMLAAVVYQESRFSINSVSHRGAVGLMQVMPQTAGTYGVNDLVNPEKNLKAGTSHLKRLQKMLSKSGLEGDELVKFTLAAYNAGEGRIADCRRFAESINADSRKWSEITSIIPQMREDSILENKDVKLGKFQGYETIAYVDNIMSLYESICMIHPSR